MFGFGKKKGDKRNSNISSPNTSQENIKDLKGSKSKREKKKMDTLPKSWKPDNLFRKKSSSEVFDISDENIDTRKPSQSFSQDNPPKSFSISKSASKKKGSFFLSSEKINLDSLFQDTVDKSTEQGKHSPRSTKRESKIIEPIERPESTLISFKNQRENLNPPKTRRDSCIRELFSTEINYLDHLEELCTTYLPGLKQLCTPEEIKQLFSNLEILRNYGAVLLKKLGEKFDNWTDQSTIGDVFLLFTPFLISYNQYYNNYEDALSLLIKLQHENQDINQFVNVQNKASHGMDLQSLLITPIQRIPRYELLLKTILKETPKTHPDFLPLTQAVSKITEQTIKMNSVILENSQRKNFSEIIDIFPSLKKFVTPWRKLIKMLYNCEIVFKGNEYSSSSEVRHPNNNTEKSRNGVLVLFSDMLFIGTVDENSIQNKKEKGSNEKNRGSIEKNRSSIEKNRGSIDKNRGSNEKNRGSNEKNRGSNDKNRGSNEKNRGSNDKNRGSNEKNRGSNDKNRGSNEKSPPVRGNTNTLVPLEATAITLRKNSIANKNQSLRKGSVSSEKMPSLHPSLRKGSISSEKSPYSNNNHQTSPKMNSLRKNSIPSEKTPKRFSVDKNQESNQTEEVLLEAYALISGIWIVNPKIPQLFEIKTPMGNYEITTQLPKEKTDWIASVEDVMKKNNVNFFAKTRETELDLFEEGKFSGTLKEGLPHGNGKIVFPEGPIYEGEWNNGIIHGNGSLIADDLFSFEGFFSHGELLKGVLKFLGATFTGEFENGYKCHKGKLEFSNGDFYEGDFKNDTFSGFGRYVYKNGDSYVGNWKNGKKSGHGLLYTALVHYDGEWCDDFKHGKGKLIVKSTGDIYEGDFENDKKSGYGKLITTDWVYEGDFNNNFIDGKGRKIWKIKLTPPDDTTIEPLWWKEYEGSWQCDERHGFGIEEIPPHYRYEGNWVNDLKEGQGKERQGNLLFLTTWISDIKNGKGTISDERGWSQSVSWKQGELVETKIKVQLPELDFPIPKSFFN